jgi:hypothetical protein
MSNVTYLTTSGLSSSLELLNSPSGFVLVAPVVRFQKSVFSQEIGGGANYEAESVTSCYYANQIS